MNIERRMPRRHRRIAVNEELRNELIKKGRIVPREMVPFWLRKLGYEAAADAALERLKGRYNG